MYEYNTDRMQSYIVSGYNYSNGTWYNTSVIALQDSDNRNLTVRFGADTTNEFQCVSIGETNTTWVYPNIVVRDYMAGHDASTAEVLDGWTVEFVTTDTATYNASHTNNSPIVQSTRIAGQVSVANGGTGSNTAAGARTNLGAASTSVATTSADGLMSSTDKSKLDGISTGADVTPSWVPATDPSYLTAHPAVTEATANLSNSGRTYIQSITLDSNGHVTAVSTGTETVTNTNTTYSAGTGLDLSGTTFSVEADLRDGITHVGKDSNNYIQFDSTNGRIDFYAGGVFVARMESDGDLHVKGDVIAFSSIFA